MTVASYLANLGKLLLLGAYPSGAETELEVVAMMSKNRVACWSKAALLAGILALVAMLSVAATGRGGEIQKDSGTAKPAKAEGIDWNQACGAWKKSLTNEQPTPDEQVCLDRAKAAPTKQGIDVKRVDELAKKALGGAQLPPDEEAYLDRVKQAIQGHSPEETAKGIASCVEQIHQRLPQAKVLLVGISLPEVGNLEATGMIPHPALAKAQVAKTKELVAKLADGKRVRFVDPGPNLLARKKEIEEGIAKKGDIHDVTAIWEALAESIAEPLQAMLKAEPSR